MRNIITNWAIKMLPSLLFICSLVEPMTDKKSQRKWILVLCQTAHVRTKTSIEKKPF